MQVRGRALLAIRLEFFGVQNALRLISPRQRLFTARRAVNIKLNAMGAETVELTRDECREILPIVHRIWFKQYIEQRNYTQLPAHLETIIEKLERGAAEEG